MPRYTKRLRAHDAHAFWLGGRQSSSSPGGNKYSFSDGWHSQGTQGGYNLDSISVSAAAVARILLGEAPPELPPMVASETATETVWQVAKTLSRFWKCLDPKALEPRDG